MFLGRGGSEDKNPAMCGANGQVPRPSVRVVEASEKCELTAWHKNMLTIIKCGSTALTRTIYEHPANEMRWIGK